MIASNIEFDALVLIGSSTLVLLVSIMSHVGQYDDSLVNNISISKSLWFNSPPLKIIIEENDVYII